jgi:nucleoside 2-deoxyribosyltransferase
MTCIYLAGPLFTEAERAWHTQTKHLLQQAAAGQDTAINVVWPYELITTEEIVALGSEARTEIFRRCKDGLDNARIVVALLDGTQVDDGTAWEIGYFFSRKSAGQTIIGIRTDFRKAGESASAIVNAMIEMACDRIVHDRNDLMEAVLLALGSSNRTLNSRNL